MHIIEFCTAAQQLPKRPPLVCITVVLLKKLQKMRNQGLELFGVFLENKFVYRDSRFEKFGNQLSTKTNWNAAEIVIAPEHQRRRRQKPLSSSITRSTMMATWLPDGYTQIFRSYVFGPSGIWTMAPLRYAAKFDPFLSLDCARVEGGGRNPRKGRIQILQRSVAEP